MEENLRQNVLQDRILSYIKKALPSPIVTIEEDAGGFYFNLENKTTYVISIRKLGEGDSVSP